MMMSVKTSVGIVTRRMQESDLARLEEMYESYVPLGGALGLPPRDSASRRYWLEGLRRGINIVGFVEEHVAGHTVLLPTGGALELIAYVHQDFRRKGMLTAMTQAAIEDARSGGASYIWFLAAKTNLAAERFAGKLGFRVAWQDPHEIQFMYPLR